MSCLHLLEINPLSVVSFAVIFSHSESCFIHLAYSFVFCAKSFQINQVTLVYFCFYFHYSRRCVIDDLAVVYVKECSAYVFLCFIVSCLTFRSQFILSLSLCMVLGSVLNFFFYRQLSSSPSTTYYRDYLFPIVQSYLLCQR